LYIEAQIHKASALSSLSMFDQSLKLIYDLLKLAERKNLLLTQSKLNYDLGQIYFSMRDFKQYLACNQKAKENAIKAKSFDDTLKINGEIGLALVGLGKKEQGIFLLKQTISELKKGDDEMATLTAIDNLSNAYLENGDVRQALKYQLEIYHMPLVNKNLIAKAGINQHLAEIYIEAKEYGNAQKYVSLAIQYAKQLGSIDWLFDCFKNQATIYESQGNYKLALDFHEQYVTLKDSVYQKNYDVKMSAAANFYELEHKQNEIQFLANEKLLNQAKIERLYLIIATLVLLLLVIIMFIHHRKNRREKIMRRQFSMQLIQAQENERQRISKDLHDSVGQNILFIKNKVQKLFANQPNELNQSIDAALEEVRNISKELYPNQLEQYGLISAIEGLCEKVKESTSIFISSDIELPNENFSKDTRINCYRIVQECVNNTIKHARANAIRITGKLVDNHLQLIIQDNGIGFEKSKLSQNANRSFGMLNLAERVRLLNGKFDVETSIGKGTKSWFLIPILK
jgi:signal transduction histidine kinase